MPRACRQAVGTPASTTNGTKDRRGECGLWVFNLRPSLNLWIARINLFWLRLRRAGPLCEICGLNPSHFREKASLRGAEKVVELETPCSAVSFCARLNLGHQMTDLKHDVR